MRRAAYYGPSLSLSLDFLNLGHGLGQDKRNQEAKKLLEANFYFY